MISSSDKVKSLTLELQRKEDDDLKEKLADSKKQIQQVQKEVCHQLFCFLLSRH